MLMLAAGCPCPVASERKPIQRLRVGDHDLDYDGVLNDDDACTTVLYIGPHFGRRFAESLEDYAHVAGFEDHAQDIEFSGRR